MLSPVLQPTMTDSLFEDFMANYTTVSAPARFMGVASTIDTISAFLMSKTMDDNDPNNGTVHIYVCRPCNTSRHTFAVAWQFTPVHLAYVANAMANADADSDHDDGAAN